MVTLLRAGLTLVMKVLSWAVSFAVAALVLLAEPAKDRAGRVAFS